MDTALIGLLPDVPPGLPGIAVRTLEAARAQQCTLVLGWFGGKLALKACHGKETPLAVEFSAGKQGYRLAADRVRHERLVKALGGLPEQPRTVVDGTGGLGRDALVMAQAGYQVVIIERSAILHAMLADGLCRLRGEDETLATRLSLHHADSSDWLTQLSAPAYAVYLDPMFPERQKSAAVKKDLLWLQQLELPPSEDSAASLLAVARARADRRVVVKRPLKAPPLAGQAPAYTLAGKSVRFDVYLCQHHQGSSQKL